jgi:dTDP-4-dehydrorhamnose reductase
MTAGLARPVLTNIPPPAPVPLPLLITGVSGVAGYSAFFHFRRLFPGQLVGIRPTRTWKLVGPALAALDTENETELADLFRLHRFRAVLNATGSCALKSCELDPAMAHRTNVVSARHVARLARLHGARLVHLSSDLVFSGAGAGRYEETDPVDPVTVYGRTMAEAEEVVLQRDPGAAVLRISLPMGPSFNGHAGAIDWIASRFRAGRPATLYFDEVRSATYADDLSRVFAYFLGSPAAGIFHLGGPRALTLNQIGQVVNKAGGYPPSLLRGCLRHQAGPVPPRAGDVSMDSGKLLALLGGNPFHPWPLDADLVPGDGEWHHRRPADWPGSEALLQERLYRHPQIPGGAPPEGRPSHPAGAVHRTSPGPPATG